MPAHGGGSARAAASTVRWTEYLTMAVAGLLLVIVSPQVLATHWTPKAALALVIIGPGLAALALGVIARDRAAIAASAFLAVAAIATVASPAPMMSLVGLYNYGTGLLFVAAVVGMWALGRRFCAPAAERLAWVLVGAATANATMMWVQNSRAFNGDLFTLIDGRPPGFLGNPVHATALLLGASALVIEQWRRVPVRGTTADTRKGLALLVLGALFASALELSGGRIGIVVLVVVVIVAMARSGVRRGAALIVVIGLGLGAASLAGQDGSGAATRVAGSSDSSLNGRIDRWRMAEPAIRARPVFGIGPGLYRRGTSRFATQASARAFGADTVNIDAHNLVVEYLVTTGIVGTIALLGWLGFAARGARGGLAWFAAVGAISLALQPEFVGLTPVLALALGSATRGPPSRPFPRALVVAAAALTVAGAIVGAALVRGDAVNRDALVRHRPADGRAAVRAVPIWPTPELSLAAAYADVAALHHRRVDWTRAITATRAAHRRDPSDPDPLIRLGGLEFEHGSLARARAAFVEARYWNPESVNARIGLARVEARAGNQRTSNRLCMDVRVLAPRVHCPLRN